MTAALACMTDHGHACANTPVSDRKLDKRSAALLRATKPWDPLPPWRTGSDRNRCASLRDGVNASTSLDVMSHTLFQTVWVGAHKILPVLKIFTGELAIHETCTNLFIALNFLCSVLIC